MCYLSFTLNLISTFLFQVIKTLEKTVVVIQNGYPETKATAKVTYA
jgi:hypothetical protein